MISRNERFYEILKKIETEPWESHDLASEIEQEIIDLSQLEQLYTAAVKKDTHFFAHVPHRLRTFPLSLLAVKGDYTNLKFVPVDYLDSPDFSEAVEKSRADIRANWHLLYEFKNLSRILTREMCFEVIENYNSLIVLLPQELIDFDLSMQIIKRDPIYGFGSIYNKAAATLNDDELKLICEEAAKENENEALLCILCQSIKKGDINSLSELLEQSPELLNKNSNIIFLKKNINGKTYKIQSPSLLHIAVFYNNNQIISFLIEKGANVNAKSESGDTPLHCAAVLGNVDILKHLIDHGAEIEEPDQQGCTSLHIASRYGQLESVDELIKQGANINAINNKDRNALHLIIQNPKLNEEKKEIICKYLIRYGIDSNQCDCDEKNPFELANMKNSKLVNHLKAYKEQQEEFIAAILRGDIKTVTEFLSNDKTLMNIVTRKKHLSTSPFLLAAIYGHVDIVNAFLHAGCTIDTHDKYGFTALCWAAYYGRETVIHTLITKGAKLTHKSNGGISVLHMAADSDKDTSTIIEQLIHMGMNVDERDHNGQTPLHYAAMVGNITAAKKLIELGADINAKDYFGRTPYNRAATKGHPLMMKLFQAKGATANNKHEKILTQHLFVQKLPKNPSRALMAEGKRLMKIGKTVEAQAKFSAAKEKLDRDLQTHKKLATELEMYISKLQQLMDPPHYDYHRQANEPLDTPALLMSRTRTTYNIEPQLIYDWFKKLYMHPQLKSLLDYVALDFCLNEKANIRTVHDTYKGDRKKPTLAFYQNSSVVVKDKYVDEADVKTNLVHELTHYFLKKLFQNKTKPFNKNDKVLKNEFKEAAKQALINIYKYYDAEIDSNRFQNMTSWEIGLELSKNKIVPNESLLNIIQRIYKKQYEEEDEVSEFAARYTEALATTLLSETKEPKLDEQMQCLNPIRDYYLKYIFPHAQQLGMELVEIMKQQNQTSNKNNL